MSHSGKPGTKETWTEFSRPVATDWRSLKMKPRGHWHNSPCGPGRSRPWREPASPPSRRSTASKPSLPGSGPSRSSFEPSGAARLRSKPRPTALWSNCDKLRARCRPRTTWYRFAHFATGSGG